MKAQIVYASKAGFAKKTALALGKMLDLPVAHVSEHPDLTDVECLCLVSELRGGECLPDILTYVKGLKTKEVPMAAVVTCTGQLENTQQLLISMLNQKNIEVNGESVCLSRELFMNLGHPNKSDYERAAKYLKGILGIPLYD